MVVESAVRVAIGTSLASALLEAVRKKSVDALSKTYSAAGLKPAILGNLKPKLVNLERELTMLDAFLYRAENLNHAQHNGNNPVLPWLRSVREAADFADNLLDDISYDQLRRQAESHKMADLLSGSDGTSFEFRRKIGSKLSKFQSMTAKIYKGAADIGLSPVDLLANPTSYQPPSAAMSTDLREMSENVDTSLVVGRQPDEDFIVHKLSLPDNQDLGVIAIFGMSGVGKTALARRVYDNESVTNNYKQKTWISMNRNFNLTTLLDNILQSLTGVSHNLSSTDAMEKKIRGCLQKERYLLVLDDVWSTSKQVWDPIRSSLDKVTDGCTGSKVLVTTESSEFASAIGDYHSHEVKKLSNDDAWALFEGKAFANKSPQQALDLRDVGKRILRRCEGLPSAINILTSILASMNERSQWESVDRSWKLSEGQTKIMPWLLLSFIHLLTPAIKQCFAHCSIVLLTYDGPDGVMERKLISCWIAQGFILLPETSDQDMMAIGRSYINFMLANGLLRSSYHGNERFIFMTNRIHDLAFYVSDHKYLTISGPYDLHKASSGVEHVLIYDWNASNTQLNFPEGNTKSTLRTLICYDATISIDLVAQARLLRQLNLRSCGLKEIPSSIGGLKHLRILDLSDNPFEYLPKTIGNLYHLHGLGLERCHRLVELPQQVTKLLSLRMISTTQAVHIPKGMGQLTRLTQLPVVKLKAWDGSKITELRSLLHLRGRVAIEQLENASSKEDAMAADLKIKAGITNLKLVWTPAGNTVCSNDEEFMEGLQPHSNLEALEVWNFRGKRFSQWLSSGLYYEKLTFLVLLDCKRCEQLPTLGCLPNLKILRIEGMDSVEVIGNDFFYTRDQRVAVRSSTESGLFPQLKEFSLSNMPRLKEWFDLSGSCASAFPLLEVLFIANCPSLVSVPTCFHSLKQLIMNGINSGEPLLLILSNSYNLMYLLVEDLQQITCLPEQLMKCTSLRILKIKNCKKLVELPPTLQGLVCLETLLVKECDSLKSIPDIKGLVSLRDLTIVYCRSMTDAPCGLESCAFIESLCLINCPELKFIPDLASLIRLRYLAIAGFSEQMMVPQWLNQLSSLSALSIGDFSNELDDFSGIDRLPKCLKELDLVGWPKLKSIPSVVQSLTQLEVLRIFGFEGVMALPEWMGSLSSLQQLHIWSCKNMKQLPSSEVMRSLTGLREFTIRNCPILEERCSKDGGEEWPKISHIPTIKINEIRVS